MSNTASFPFPAPGPSERGQAVLRLLLLVGAYVGSGRLGLAIPYIGSNITLVWLPTGIAVAALVRWGARYWPGVWLGALLVNLSIGSSWLVAGSISLGNTLGPLATWWLLQRLDFHRTFDRQKDVALFVLGAGSGMLLTASGGVASLWLTGLVPAELAGRAWLTWWLGDTVGILLAGPLLLTISRSSRQSLSCRRSELAVWCLVTLLVAWGAFILNAGQGTGALPLVFLTLPLAVWAALRFGVTGASLAALLLSAIATWGTAHGRGPFFLNDVHQGLMLLWAFMVALVLIGLLITALQAEGGRAEAEIKSSQERLSSLIEAMPDAIFFKDGAGRWLITNGPARRLFQLQGNEWRGITDAALGAARPEFGELSSACQRDDELAWQAGKLCLFEEQLRDAEGRLHQFEVRKVPIFESDGHRKGLIVISRDVTEERNAQREIERLSQRNELLLMAAGEGIYGLDEQERLTFINPAAQRMLGYSADELIGQVPPWWHPEQAADERLNACPVRQTLADGLPRRGCEAWFLRRDGRGFPAMLTVSPIGEPGRLSGAVVTFQDVTERKQAEAEIHRLAFYDPLTGLANRRLLHDRLAQAFAKSARQRSHGAVLFIDLDHFKALNDTLGHDVGDVLLVEVARRLVEAVREEDTVARLGGDEFVVMLERLGGELLPAAFQAERVAEKIRTALNQPYVLKGQPYRSSPSIGISLFLGEQKTRDELLKHADIALYRAKKAGRNTVRCYDVTAVAERGSGAGQPIA